MRVVSIGVETHFYALSELAKRVDYDDCVRLSSRFVFYTGRSECDVMWSALHMLQAALAWPPMWSPTLMPALPRSTRPLRRPCGRGGQPGRCQSWKRGAGLVEERNREAGSLAERAAKAGRLRPRSRRSATSPNSSARARTANGPSGGRSPSWCCAAIRSPSH
jgi:hypothetical protein